MPREIEPLEGARWTTTRPQTTHNAPFAGLGYWNPAFAGLGAYVTQPKMEALRDAVFEWANDVFGKYERPAPGTQARNTWDKINAILVGLGDWADSEGMDRGAPGYDLWAAKFDEAQVLFDRIRGLLVPYEEPAEPVGPVRRGEDIAISGRVGPWPAAIGLGVFALAIAVARGRR
jgi:hypothetical protein